MKDDRFAGLGAQALNEAERESVVRLALEVMAKEVANGPLMTSEADTVRYLQLKTGAREREVFGCLFLTLCAALSNVKLRRRGSVTTAEATIAAPHNKVTTVASTSPCRVARAQRARSSALASRPERLARAPDASRRCPRARIPSWASASHARATG